MGASDYVNRTIRHRATGAVGRITAERFALLGCLLEIQLGDGGRDTLTLRRLEAEYEFMDGMKVEPRRSAEVIPFPVKHPVIRVIPIRTSPMDGGAA